MTHSTTRIRPWQTVLLSSAVATGLVLVLAPQLALGATGTSTAPTPVAAVAEPAYADVPLVRNSVPDPQRIVQAPPALEKKPPVVVAAPLVTGVTGYTGTVASDGSPLAGTAASGAVQQRAATSTPSTPSDPTSTGPTTSFKVATINTLGDSHTRRGGNKSRYASGVERTSRLLGIMTAQGIDVVGLQEFERPQKAAFKRIAPGWRVFTGSERGRDSIAYRTDVWEYVAGGRGTIPYFRGNPAPMPWVTLKHVATGRQVSFLSIHNPVSNRRRGNNAVHRARATNLEIAKVRELAAGGNPVLLLGDFNERDVAFCRVTAGGDIAAANGGSRGGTCRPPRKMGIDWIFGTTDIAFSEYLRHQDGQVRRTTDHPVIVARATITEALPAG